MRIDARIENACLERKDFCLNCDSKFQRVRPLIRSVAVSRHFVRDLKDEEKMTSIVKNILDCSHLEFVELHKFEERADGNLVFRARKEGLHIVYSIDKMQRIVFLRAIRNFTEYKKFLENTKEIKKMVLKTRDL